MILSPTEAGAKLGTAARYHPENVPAARKDLAAANICKAITEAGDFLLAHGLRLTPEHAGLLFLQLQKITER